MPKPKNPIIEIVYALLEPIVEAQNTELYDIEFLTENGRQILRLYIEKESGGVTLDDCERITYAVEPVLDTHDPVPGSYVLEVSSPGIERKLVKEHHFAKHIGQQVEVRLDKPFNRQKKFRGKLMDFKEGFVVVDELQLPKEHMIYCRLVYTD